MKFYNRETELAHLKKIEEQSLHTAQMTFVVGRRRIGKTSLLHKSVEGKTFLYFFIARKNEVLLCDEFVETIKLTFSKEMYGSLKSFKDIFGYLIELSKTTHFTLIIDEFQEFNFVNPGVFSEMQHIWDMHKSESKINLILCGSVYSMMKRIFEHSKEPLFGRATQRIQLKEFSIQTIKDIYADYYPAYSSEDLLTFYMITGGVAKYVETLVDSGVFTHEAIIDLVCSENSIFIDEGKNMLIDEFGKEYANYFSILSLIASSKTSRNEMESMLGMQIGGFLDRLESDFGIIRRVKPIFSKPNSRTMKYAINDNFLNFWFRFVYKHQSAVEIGNLQYLKEIIQRDYATYSGKILEKYFIEKIIKENNFSAIGSYWEKGNTNEIDIVAVNELEKTLLFVEVKRKSDKIQLDTIRQKSRDLIQKYKNYTIEYKGLSLNDM